MHFRLTYQGPLKTNRGTPEKHDLRRHFHRQLKDLMSRPPLRYYRELIDKRHEQDSRATVRKVRGFEFTPLITEKLQFVACLDVLMLTRDEPGQAIQRGGDIDNRMKTLLDALRTPQQEHEVPPEAYPTEEEVPFFTLLEDDALISSLSVASDRLLIPAKEKSDVFLLIHVEPVSVRFSFADVVWVS